MSDSSNEASLVLNQLRSSLDANRYTLSAVYAAVALAFGGAGVGLAVIFFLWHVIPEVYASFSHLQFRIAKLNVSALEAPPQPPSIWQCIKQAWNLSDKQLIETRGIDAVVYIRALRMIFWIFVVLTVLLFGTAAPVNIVYNLRVQYVTNLTKQDALMLLTPSLLKAKQMVPHVVLGWTANFVVFAILWYNYVRVLAIRHARYGSMAYQNNKSNRAVLVVDLPKNLRSSHGVQEVLARSNPKAVPDHVIITQSMKRVRELVMEHDKLVRKYERIMTSGDRTKGPDILERLRILQSQIEDARAQEVGPMNNYGFGFYGMVKDAMVSAKTKGAVQMAPPPDQIIWTNLKLTAAERATKQLLMNTLYGALLLVWIIPSAFISCFLSNLNRLGAVWSAFGQAMNRHPVWFAILQGVLAPAVTSAFFSGLPILFRRFSHLQGKVTRVDREREVLRKLYSFFFIDNYLIFSFIGVIWDIVVQVLEQTKESKNSGNTLTFSDVWTSMVIAQRIATAIVNVSSFWVMYLLKGILELFVTLTQPMELLKRSSDYLNFTHKRTPREVAENAIPQPFPYATNFLNVLFYATIALGFTTIQPLVLPVALIYYGLAIPLKKYEVVNMKRTNYESNGSYWPLIVDILLFALGFGNLILLCVVWVQSGWRIAAGAIPLAGTVVVFKIVIHIKFDHRFRWPETNETFETTAFRAKQTLTKEDFWRYQDHVNHGGLATPILSKDEAFQVAYATCEGEREDNSLTHDPYDPAHVEMDEKEYDEMIRKELFGTASVHPSTTSTASGCYEPLSELPKPVSDSHLNGDDGYDDYSVGAVPFYSLSNATPYSPIEPQPAYQSNEGRAPRLSNLHTSHTVKEHFDDDERRLL